MTIAYAARTTIACTLASLANGSYRESAEVSNASPLDTDFALSGFITTGTSPTPANAPITIFVWGGDGTNRAANATGADAAYTSSTEDTQLRVAHVIPVTTTSNQRYDFYIGSIAALFGGICPPRWGVVILNGTGVALNATGGNHELAQQSIDYSA